MKKYEDNKEYFLAKNKKWRENNKDKLCAYRKSAKGKASMMWSNMVARCGSDKPKNKAYKHIKIDMTKEEWYAWAIPEIDSFMKNNPDKTPSVDRIDVGGDYKIGNIRIIDFIQNSKNSTARIESAFSKIAELYGDKPLNIRQQIFNEFIDKVKRILNV